MITSYVIDFPSREARRIQTDPRIGQR
jgi:hypothetical protein